MRAFEHVSVASAEDALAELNAHRDGDARFIAGGTDLLTLMKADLVAPVRLIDLKPLAQLRGIRRQPDGATSMGALTTLADIERDSDHCQRVSHAHTGDSRRRNAATTRNGDHWRQSLAAVSLLVFP